MQGRDSDTAKPEVRAIQEATTTPLPQLVSRVVYLLGDRLACFIADADDVRILESWRAKGNARSISVRRLNIALQTALILRTRYQPDQIAPWFTWLNERLDDKSPASVLRSANTAEELADRARSLLAAAKMYLVE
jgi:hypothetical protein